ncbi:bifunctional (p)ppGpp synthetase/guanosine-3',5'-bis(diphosphate) 3'-pyrophosphohydrolase [Desulfobulbus rhabdoformis]|uniref:RelA/SpoT family protein n=1 Tax=Desulfobulbus rhabdoformis TaxID=34032 RepID=UPI001962C3CF|nr:HD domain-containing protein [Desulfobulbus rhabdoformis]MBM9616261.1 bifunctional (p)ppGpp synthetase/guanosine-3',5'-bis(diphosphate) 3'-pyrophosphohydrolase [Desulfobulbus rhabdoformis]
MHYTTFDLEAYRRVMLDFIGDGPESQVFWKALDFAVDAHGDQWRRSGDPYIMHPCSVARILAEELDLRNPEILASALLHDTVEDVEEITDEVIREQFGPTVEAIVEGCTKVTHYSGDRQTFKKLVHRKIFSGAAAKLEVMIVKLADRLHNLRTLASMPKRKRQKIADETLDIYAPLATILGLFAIKRELYNLALAYKFPRQGSRLQMHINSLRNDPTVLAIVDNVQKAIEEEGLKGTVTLRTKGLWGYYDVRNHILIKEIESPQEMLILMDTRSECYQALGVLNRIYPPIPRTIRDFIASPKPSGYQGLHARPNIDGRKYLFKIRTKDMARRAQRGMIREWTSDTRINNRYFREIQEMFDILGSDDSVSYRDMIAASGRKEIYTYTPQGDLICLPVNSILLDFAFRVHTAIGHTCIGGMIGKQKVKPDQQLRDGSVIKVLRQKDEVNFDPALQMLCQTPKARSELSKAFRKRREAVSRQIGASVLSQELRRYGVPFEVLEKEEMVDIMTYFGIDSLDELYLQVGEGRVRLRELIYEIRNGLYVGRPTLFQPTGVFNRVDLVTLDPVVLKSSACCKPGPLDKGVIGLLSERGLSLHRKDCSQLQKVKFQREDAVEVRWKLKGTRIEKTQRIIVMQATRNRLLMMLSVAPEEMKVTDIVYLGKGASAVGDWEVHFQVANLYGLKKVDRHFERSGLLYDFELEH